MKVIVQLGFALLCSNRLGLFMNELVCALITILYALTGCLHLSICKRLKNVHASVFTFIPGFCGVNSSMWLFVTASLTAVRQNLGPHSADDSPSVRGHVNWFHVNSLEEPQ